MDAILRSRQDPREPVRFRKNALPRGNTFRRSLTARVVGNVLRQLPSDVAARLWPSDNVTAEILERAASAPAMTTVTGWAAELVQTFVTDAISVMASASAGAQMLREGLVLAFDRAGVILIPGLVVDATSAGFVVEGAPIPVHNFNLTPAQMQPNLIASIAVLTREMIESSNAEALIGDALVRAAGLALDAALFDANAATAARPAGLRNGITALTPSAAPDITEAYFEDISALIGAASTVGGSGPFFLVGSAARAYVLNMRFIRGGETPAETQKTILGSSALGNDLMAVAPAALAAVIGLDPTIETSRASTLHMETVPQPVGTVSPHKSMWQTDSIAVKLRWPLSWTRRDPRGVAWMTPTWK
jgi:hypothetical protein